MISSKTLPENDDSQAFDSILIILFVMDFNKNFKVRVQNVLLMKSTKKLGECEDYEACDSTLQTGHVFGPNGVQQHFYRKGSKMTLW